MYSYMCDGMFQIASCLVIRQSVVTFLSFQVLKRVAGNINLNEKHLTSIH